MTTLRLTNDQWQALKLFARGRDAGFIAEALQIPRKDVVSTITTVAAGDPEKAAQVVAAYEQQADLVAAARGNLPVRQPAAVPAPRSTPVMSTPTGVLIPGGQTSTPVATRSILERGAASEHARTRALADKIHVLLAELDTRVQTEEHERLGARGRRTAARRSQAARRRARPPARRGAGEAARGRRHQAPIAGRTQGAGRGEAGAGDRPRLRPARGPRMGRRQRLRLPRARPVPAQGRRAGVAHRDRAGGRMNLEQARQAPRHRSEARRRDDHLRLPRRRRARVTAEPCDGLCVTAADIGIPSAGVAYPHPGCPLHAPDQVCECGQPDRCVSPTHGQISMVEARRIRNSQASHGDGAA